MCQIVFGVNNNRRRKNEMNQKKAMDFISLQKYVLAAWFIYTSLFQSISILQKTSMQKAQFLTCFRIIYIYL